MVLTRFLGDNMLDPSDSSSVSELLNTGRPSPSYEDTKMPLTAADANVYVQLLNSICDFFRQSEGDIGKVKVYEHIANQLSKVVERQPAWGWRYVQGVEVGTILPSAQFCVAIKTLAAVMDDVPLVAARTEAVQVYAIPGTVKAGSVILGISKPCARPGCPVWFVPNVPNRRYCSVYCAKKAHKH